MQNATNPHHTDHPRKLRPRKLSPQNHPRKSGFRKLLPPNFRGRGRGRAALLRALLVGVLALGGVSLSTWAPPTWAELPTCDNPCDDKKPEDEKVKQPPDPETSAHDEPPCNPDEKTDTGQTGEGKEGDGSEEEATDGAEAETADDPVVIATGEFFKRRFDLRNDTDGQLFSVIRRYSNQSTVDRGFGRNWDSNLYARVEDMAGEALVYTNDRLPLHFAEDGDDYVSNHGHTLEKQAGSGHYTMTRRNGVRWYFDSTGRVLSKTLRTGQAYIWAYDGTNKVTAIKDGASTEIYRFHYDGTLITKVEDAIANRNVVYDYDTGSRQLTRSSGTCGTCSPLPAAAYEYDVNHNMLTIRNGRGDVTLANIYDGAGRVSIQARQPSVESRYDYSNHANGVVKLVDYNRVTRTWHHDNAYHLTRVNIEGELTGLPRSRTWDYIRVPPSTGGGGGGVGSIMSTTTAGGRVVDTPRSISNGKIAEYILDNNGTSITYRAFEWGDYGQATVATYPPSTGGSETRIFDANGNRLTLSISNGVQTQVIAQEFDNRGNLLARTNPDGRKVAFEYNPRGHLTRRIADPDGLALTETYHLDAAGNITRRIDARGKVWQNFYTPAGQVTRRVDPLGRTTAYVYDVDQNLVTRIEQDDPDNPSITRTTVYEYDAFGNVTRRVDPGPGNGRITDFAYDAYDRVTYRKLPTGEEQFTQYDEMGHIFKELVYDAGNDATIARMTYLYDGDGNLTQQTDANGHAVSRAYDYRNKLTRQTDALGHYTELVYDDEGNLTRKRWRDSGDALYATVDRAYDVANRLTRRERSTGGGDSELVHFYLDDAGNVTRRRSYLAGGAYAELDFVYDDAGRRITRDASGADGPTVARVYDDAGNLLTQTVDPAGLALTTSWAYDDQGRVTRLTQPDETYEVTLYDGLGRVTKTQSHASGGSRFAVSELHYDDNLNVVTKVYRYADPASQSAFDDDTDPAMAWLYDANGELTATVDPNGNTTSYAYDSLGRRITTTDPLNNREILVYDDADNVLTRTRIDAPGSVAFVTAFDYDPRNMVTRTIDQGPDGTIGNGDDLVALTWYDALGRITQTQDPAGTQMATYFDQRDNITRTVEDVAGLARYTDSRYDRANRLTRLTGYTNDVSGSQHTDYLYSKADVVTRVVYPDDSGGDRGFVVYEYDAALRLTKMNDQENQDTVVTWDGAGRPIAITKGTEVDTYTWKPWGAVATANRGTSGNPDVVSAVTRSYDGLNRLTRESQSIREGTARNVDYAYDRAGNVLTLTYPSGVTIQTSYDALNRANILKRNTTQFAAYDYVGPRVDMLTYETGANDVVLTNAYDGMGRLTRMTYARTGNTTLLDFTYAFDAASNITRKTFEHRSGEAEDYAYDTLYRLTRTTFGQRTDTPYEGFIYDHLGNHLTQDHDGTLIAGLFNAVNEQTKRDGVDVLYDKRGNLTKDDDGQVYFYDRQNMLTRVEKPANTLVASYAYDALNRRIEKDVDGDGVTRFYWTNGWQLLEETDDSATPVIEKYYVWGGTYIDELILYHNTSGGDSDYFVCRNHNFNVVALLDTSGGVVERYDYNPYGQRFVLDADYSDDADGVSDVGFNIGHQGLYHDEESGLVYNRARYRNRWGFITRDPLGYYKIMSMYTYVANNPLFWVDAFGLTEDLPYKPPKWFSYGIPFVGWGYGLGYGIANTVYKGRQAAEEALDAGDKRKKELENAADPNAPCPPKAGESLEDAIDATGDYALEAAGNPGTSLGGPPGLPTSWEDAAVEAINKGMEAANQSPDSGKNN